MHPRVVVATRPRHLPTGGAEPHHAARAAYPHVVVVVEGTVVVVVATTVVVVVATRAVVVDVDVAHGMVVVVGGGVVVVVGCCVRRGPVVGWESPSETPTMAATLNKDAVANSVRCRTVRVRRRRCKRSSSDGRGTVVSTAKARSLRAISSAAAEASSSIGVSFRQRVGNIGMGAEQGLKMQTRAKQQGLDRACGETQRLGGLRHRHAEAVMEHDHLSLPPR